MNGSTKRLVAYSISVGVIVALCRHSFGLGFWLTMGIVYLWAYADWIFDGVPGDKP